MDVSPLRARVSLKAQVSFTGTKLPPPQNAVGSFLLFTSIGRGLHDFVPVLMCLFTPCAEDCVLDTGLHAFTPRVFPTGLPEPRSLSCLSWSRF